MSRRALVVALVIITGAGLRCWDVTGALVWHDETFTQVFAAGRGSADWLPLFDGEVREVGALRAVREHDAARSMGDTMLGLARDEPQHPPLYYLSARAFAGGLDASTDVTEAAARLRWLSVLIGIAGFGAMAWLARELFVDRRQRLVALALYAVSPFLVLYAQEARAYALWTVFTIASTAALLRARRLGTAAGYALYALTLTLGLYTSFSMVTVALGHAVLVVGRARAAEPSVRRRSLAGFALAALAAGVLFLPWAAMLMRHYGAFSASMAWSRDIRVPIGEVLATFGLNLSRAMIDLGGDAPTLVPSLLGVAALAGGMAGARALRARPEAMMCVFGLFLGPLLFLMIPDLLFGGIRSLSARYLTPSLLALLLAFAALAPSAVRSTREALSACALAAVLLGALGSAAYAATREVPWTKSISRRLPEVAAIVQAHPGALVVGDHERHHPGNLLTLSGMVPDDTKMQLLGTVEDYVLAEHTGPIFLFSPSPRFRDELEASAGVQLQPLVQDLHLSLWRVTR